MMPKLRDQDHWHDVLTPLADQLTIEPMISGPARLTGRKNNRHLNQVFNVNTLLTPDRLAAKGLVITGINERNSLTPGGTMSAPRLWLIEKPANAERYFETIAASHGTSVPPTWIEELRLRLADLRDMAAEDDIAPCAKSFSAAEAFASGLPHARRPAAYLVGNGNARLVWSANTGEQIGLQFRSTEECQFVILKNGPTKRQQHLGLMETAGVLQHIASLGMTHVLTA